MVSFIGMLTLVHPFATTWHFPSRGNEKFRGAFRLSADRPRMTVESGAPRSRSSPGPSAEHKKKEPQFPAALSALSLQQDIR